MGVFALIYCFISGIFYLACTSIGFIGIEGYQVRYIFPIISLLIISLSNKTLKNSKDENLLVKISSFQILFITLGLIGEMLK